MIPEVNPYNNYKGDGVATLFDYDFFIQNGSQLIVEHIDENDVVTRLEENIDYEIVVIEEEFAGYIKFPIEDSKFGILQENETLSLQLTLPFEQISEYGQSSLLDLNSIEFSYDYLTRLCQILKRQMERSVKVNEGLEATPEQLLETINNNAIVSTNAATLASQKADEAMESANVASGKVEEIDNIYAEAVEKIETDKTNALEEIGQSSSDGVEELNKIKEETKAFKDELVESGMFKFNLFDTKISDHILQGEEAKGWALQGTYVSGALYPDFYNKCLEEYRNTEDGEIPKDAPWTQPILTENGVLGGESFAVAASDVYSADGDNYQPYRMFDGDVSTSWQSNGTTASSTYFTFYNPTPLKVTKITWSGTPKYGTITAGRVFGSNNNTDWTELATFSGGTTTGGTMDLSSNTNYYKYYRITPTSWTDTSGTLTNGWAELNITAFYIDGYVVNKNSNGHKFYSVEQKPIIDEIYNQYGIADFYGIDEENERIFLPRNKYFQQLTDDVSKVNKTMGAGLPDHYHYEFNTGSGSGDGQASVTASQYPQVKGQGGYSSYVIGGTSTVATIGKSSGAQGSSVYGKSDTVQPPSSLKLLYYCVGNTEVTQAITNVTEVTTSENDTIPLFSGMYFDFNPNSVSWLKAGEQQNSAGIYKTCYDTLVEIVNGVNPYELNVINIEDMVAGVDYSTYWKLDQDNLVFQTPTAISNKALSGAVVGNGLALGLTDDTTGYGLQFNNADSILALQGNTGYFGQTLPSSGLGSGTGLSTCAVGITTDPSKSGIIAEQSAAQLYFKVANAVQNLELLDAGEVLEAVNNVIPKNSELIASYGMPDYSAGVSKTNGTTHTAEIDGWLLAHGGGGGAGNSGLNGSATVTINGNIKYVMQGINLEGKVYHSHFIPLPKGTTYLGTTSGTNPKLTLTFYPSKGAK